MKTSIMISLQPEHKKQIVKYCKDNDIKISQLLRQLALTHIEKERLRPRPRLRK